MARRRITTALKLRVWNANAGVCHICKLSIQIGETWDVEHIKPLWLGGPDTEDNMAPAHKLGCHAGKTKEESTHRAKTNRQMARHIGAVAPKAKIQSRGFQKKPRQPKPSLPPRRLYDD